MSAQHQSATSLMVELSLPFEIEVLSELPADQLLNQWNIHNEKTLHAINVMEDVLPIDSDLHHTSPDTARLEIKLDLLTNLLGRMLAQNAQFPEAQTVQLSRQQIEASAFDQYIVGDVLKIELYPSFDYPLPLTLVANIAVTENDNASLVAEFLSMGDSVVDALEKYIFRHHRRAIALLRHSN
ncbi:MAG: PilZ domain-containing protein [Gammaproteobacteria bacterium]|nr:PilZ domain-containing protein [Gammaproteobacteria bacterium]